MAHRSHLHRVTVLSSLLFAVACGSNPTPSDQEQVGTARAAIAMVPMDVQCIQITVAGNQTVTQSFDVPPGRSTELFLNDLPVGSVTVSASATNLPCNWYGSQDRGGCDFDGGPYAEVDGGPYGEVDAGPYGGDGPFVGDASAPSEEAGGFSGCVPYPTYPEVTWISQDTWAYVEPGIPANIYLRMVRPNSGSANITVDFDEDGNQGEAGSSGASCDAGLVERNSVEDWEIGNTP